MILHDEADDIIYSDLTERLPIELYTGMNYIYVCCVYKLNMILLHLTKIWEDTEMTIAFKRC